MSSQDRTANSSYGIDFTELDPEKIVVKNLEPKSSQNEKYKYANIKLGYEMQPGKVWGLTQKLPDGLRGRVKERVGDDGLTKKYSVTLMHDYDDEERGQMDDMHVQKLYDEWAQIKRLIAQSLIAMEADPKFGYLDLSTLRKSVERKGTWDVENILELIADDEIVVRDPVFQISIEKDGVRTPIENSERRLALKMKVTRPEDMPEQWRGLASKYFHPRAASQEKAEQIDINDMIDLPHTGNYRMRIPHIYVAKGEGKYPKVHVQIFMVSCFNTQIVEANSMDEAIQDEADTVVVSDEKHEEQMEIFRKKVRERKEKEEGGDPQAGYQEV